MLNTSKFEVLRLFVLFCAFFLSVPIFAAQKPETDDYQKQLDRVYRSISTVKDGLKTTQLKRGHVLTELKQLEASISRNARDLDHTRKKLGNLNRQVGELKTELNALNRELKKQRSTLASQLRAAYALGSQQHIKMLLNQQNPVNMGRVQVYFDYLNRTREQEIGHFLETIETRQKLDAALTDTLAAQKISYTKLKKQKNTLQNQRLKRRQLLARLNTEVGNQENTLADLETSRNRIENLLKSLGELLADVPSTPGDARPFGERKGHLPWPLKGKFLAQYGNAKQQGDLKWNGVLISAKYGTPVKAISHGRVAFADWLQGFGFITIIDHGDGYMSLYGHNESLLKQPGDWVAAGEVIATAGDSGGQPNSALYFEIRARGKPVNPDSWCSSKAQHTASR